MERSPSVPKARISEPRTSRQQLGHPHGERYPSPRGRSPPFWGNAPVGSIPMSVRAATEADLEALLPLMRGYCDFYETSPPDDGLRAMAEALIVTGDAEGFLLVSCDAG